MEYFLVTGLATVCAYLAVLFYYDITPYSVLYKIAGRLIRVPTRFQPVTSCAPYSRLCPWSNGVHRPVILNLETSEGSGQACHPDVVYVPGGFGEQKWPYWMTCTPYPNQNDRYENPEIFVSCDGINWVVPKGLQNPLVSSPSKAGDHNSDPDILFHCGELWLFFRQTLRSKSPVENAIVLMKSRDGVRWSAPAEILRENEARQMLSPSVIHDGKGFVMWTVEFQGALKLIRRTSPDALSWSAPVPVNLIGLQEGRFPWHIDVIQEEDRLSALLVSCKSLGGSGSRIHYAYSEDQGLTWFAGGFLFEQAYEFEANAQYRGCLRKIANHSQEYELWYSASSRTNVFSIAHVRLGIADSARGISVVRNSTRSDENEQFGTAFR